MDLGLSGKTALVTGASAGIGFAVARRLASEGVRVAICARRRDILEASAEALRQESGGTVVAIQADVTQPDDVTRLVDTAFESLGSIDILVNNTGSGTYKPFLDVTEEELLHGMQINFFAMFRVTQRVLPLMIAAGRGSIVNVTGISGSTTLDPPFFSTCTGPAKAAENRFTKALAMEFGSSNIRVNAVGPGRVDAPERFARWCRDIAARTGEDASDPAALQLKWGSRIVLPDHRWASVEEIAALVVFAASPACGSMTGAYLVADGGESRE
jgi:3-oxoacyl-[acyl-carrier protein] reductase